MSSHRPFLPLVLRSLVGALAVFSGAALEAATLDTLEGSVFVNRGNGFNPVRVASELQAGDSVMVAADGKARLVYFEGCSQMVLPGTVAVVSAVPPCSADQTGSTNTEGWSTSNTSTSSYNMGMQGADYLLGAAVIGGVAAAVVLLTDDDDDDTSSSSSSSLGGPKSNGCAKTCGAPKFGCKSEPPAKCPK